jgi:xanthine dehydrogenase accessory factor
MFEIADRLLAASENGRPIAVATAIAIDGSAPRTIGTSMAFDGEVVIGSIAGGCVEGAVVAVCEQVLLDGVPQTVEYGVSDETAFSVGLTCGGQLRIDVRLLSDAAADALRAATDSRPAGFASALGNVGPEHEARIAAELEARIALGTSGLAVIDCGETVEVFFEVSVPAAHLIVFGAMEYSAALSTAARQLGYRVTVCDPRPLFATPVRFPGAEVAVAWPTTWLRTADVDDRTVICVLSHDARYDAELIEIALSTPAAYVGAMGSRVTHDRRVASLRERGVSEGSIARLHSPIGLDLGASTVEETAIAILAEVIAARNGASGHTLTTTAGAIHSTVSTSTIGGRSR